MLLIEGSLAGVYQRLLAEIAEVVRLLIKRESMAGISMNFLQAYGVSHKRG